MTGTRSRTLLWATVYVGEAIETVTSGAGQLDLLDSLSFHPAHPRLSREVLENTYEVSRAPEPRGGCGTQ